MIYRIIKKAKPNKLLGFAFLETKVKNEMMVS